MARGMGELSANFEDLESSEGENSFEKGILRNGKAFSEVFELIFRKASD